MNDELRLQAILEMILDEDCTSEQACADCPELLPVVRRRLAELETVKRQLDAIFPNSGPDSDAREPASWLPQIEGYDVQEILGRGGMGMVYRARQLKLNRMVALKMMLGGTFAGRDERTRFQREAETIAGLKHPNIVQIYDGGELDGPQYFTMEYIEGGTLAQKLQGIPQPAREAAKLAMTLAQAIQASHASGIIHRDLKPGNVLLTVEGIPKITDFGLARKISDDARLTQTGAAIGTPSYMAPEQARGQADAVGLATDVYSLGAILYELLTGRPPFRAETAAITVLQVISQDPVPPSRLNGKIPRDLETICLKCLRKEPSGRYQSAADLAEDLRRFLDGEAILARPEGSLKRVLRRFRRRKALSFAVLVIVALVAAGIWLYAEKSASERQQLGVRQASERAVEEQLMSMAGFLRTSSWGKVRTEVDQARSRLDKSESTTANDLRRLLEQAERELQLGMQLDAIRLARATRLGNKNAAASTDRDYTTAFAAVHLGDASESPVVVAERVQQLSICDAVVAAQDDWAACTADSIRKDWLLNVARLADRDATGWRLRARDPATCQSKAALIELAPQVTVERSSVPLVLTLAEHMKNVDADPIPLLKRLQLANPDDFWANFGLAESHMEQSHLIDAIRYYQSAIALRRDATVVYDNLGLALAMVGRFEDADEQFCQGSGLDPAAMAHETLGLVSAAPRRQDFVDMSEMPRQFRERVAWLHLMLGDELREKGKLDPALLRYRQAIAVYPKLTQAQYRLRHILIKRDKLNDAWQAWRAAIEADPPDYDAWDGYMELCLFFRKDDEYRRARGIMLDHFLNDKDPRVAELTGRASLLFPASPHDLGKAEILVDRALAANPTNHYYHFAKGLSEYRQDRFDKALSIMKGEAADVMGPAPRLVASMALYQQGDTDEARTILAAAIKSFNWDPKRADNRNYWIYHILRREAESKMGTK